MARPAERQRAVAVLSFTDAEPTSQTPAISPRADGMPSTLADGEREKGSRIKEDKRWIGF